LIAMTTVRLIICASAIALLLGGAAQAKKATAGKPEFKAGDPPAFWLWSDDAGWHLRATTAKKQHAFRGVLRQAGVAAVKTTRPALASKVRYEAGALRFDFDLFEGVDGIDWQSAEPCITVELKLDGLNQPASVKVGQKAESPSALPFEACR
jgi:hypothetical protein